MAQIDQPRTDRPTRDTDSLLEAVDIRQDPELYRRLAEQRMWRGTNPLTRPWNKRLGRKVEKRGYR